MKSPIRLLLVEDDQSLGFIIKGSLELTGRYTVHIAYNGKEGLEAYAQFNPDIIVSDIEMPEMQGTEMVKVIRQNDKKIPILFATARVSPQDVIEGYNLDVDNYVKKPYLIEELDGHIRAVLKRVTTFEEMENKFEKGYLQLGEYRFDTLSHKLQWKDQQFKLTDREAKILQLLHEHAGKIVRRDDILLQFWGINDFYTSRSLDVFVSKLRKHLEYDPAIKIQTVRGEGLQLII